MSHHVKKTGQKVHVVKVFPNNHCLCVVKRKKTRNGKTIRFNNIKVYHDKELIKE